MRYRSAIFVCVLPILWVGGCTTAPKETVQLSEIVDRQIAQMQASHEQFVRLYYDRLRRDVDRFMEDVWIPQFLSNVIQGTGANSRRFREQLDRAYKLANLDWNKAVQVQEQDQDVQAAIRDVVRGLTEEKQAVLGRVLIQFSQAAQVQINAQRQRLLDPLDEQEALVLAELRAGYADIQRGEAAIKGYLASVVKLVKERDVILERLQLLEAQRELVDRSARLSEEAASALRTAEDVERAIDRFMEKIGGKKPGTRPTSAPTRP